MRTSRAGLGLAVVSAATFGSSGTFAASLLATGWSPGAAVTTRITIAALVLTVPAVLLLRGKWHLLRRDAGPVLGYGLLAIAVAQLCYFFAVEHLSVAVALLLEYSGPLLVIGWLWARHGQRPRRMTVLGGLVAVVGLMLVLDVTGGAHLDLVGVLWGLGAAIGNAGYFILSAGHGDPTRESVPPLAMAWAGMIAAALGLGLAGLLGVMPMHANTRDVTLAGAHTSWLVPIAGVSVVAAAVSYTTGIGAARLLGARLASFIGLAEVLAATLFAWALLGQRPGVHQAVGGLVVLLGIALVRADERGPEPVTAGLPLLDSGDAVHAVGSGDAPAPGRPDGGRRRRSPRALAGRLHRAARADAPRPRGRVAAADRGRRRPGVGRGPVRSTRR